MRDDISSRGVDLAAYNTAESVEDLELLRRAIGAEKIILVAHSYGTHLALAYIRQYGNHVERAMLGGVNGLDDRWREPVEGDRWIQRVSQRMRVEGVFDRDIDFTDQVRRVLSEYEQQPQTVLLNGESVLIGKAEIQLLVTLRSGDTGFVQSLPVLFHDLERRSGLDRVATAVQQVSRRRAVGTAMTYAMHVASGVSQEKRDRIAAQQETSIFGNAINWGIGDDEFVRALDVPDLGDTFRAPFDSEVPVLLISATLDGRTSETDARRVGQQFAHPSYLTLDGVSHDFYFRSSAMAPLWPRLGAFLRGERIEDGVLMVPVQFQGPA